MTIPQRISRWAVTNHAHYHLSSDRTREALAARLQIRNDRGDIEARAITIAFMAAAAIAAGGVIATKISDKSNSINLN